MKWRQANGAPFTCDLSGGDFWALVRAGFRPVVFSFGVCVYHVAHQTLGQWFSSVGANVEMPQFTQGLYDARELAMGRMQWDALTAGATAGLVGVVVDEGSHGWDHHVIEMVAVGTGVAPDPRRVTRSARTPARRSRRRRSLMPIRPRPKRLGHYDVVAKIGGGGMATIYLGRATDHVAALKVLRHDASRIPASGGPGGDQAVNMFLDEAKILSLLSHDNITRTYEYGEDAGEHYIAMELLLGRTLVDVWETCVEAWPVAAFGSERVDRGARRGRARARTRASRRERRARST